MEDFQESFPAPLIATETLVIGTGTYHNQWFWGYSPQTHPDGVTVTPILNNNTGIQFEFAGFHLVLVANWRLLDIEGYKQFQKTTPPRTFWFDGERKGLFPYAGRTKFLPSSPVSYGLTHLFQDFPATSLTYFVKPLKEVSASMSFQIFFVAKIGDKSKPSIWCPLRGFNWGWSGFSEIQQDTTWSGSVVPPILSEFPLKGLPAWKQLAIGGVNPNWEDEQ